MTPFSNGFIKLLIIVFCLGYFCFYFDLASCAIAFEQPSTSNILSETKSQAAQLLNDSNSIQANNFQDSNIISPNRKFSLQACFNTAAANNKEIAVAQSNLPIAESAVTIAKAIPNPTYNLSYGFGPAWAYIIAGNNQQFGWNEEIQVAGKRTKKTALARANYLQTFFKVESVRFNIHNRIRRAYAELAIATSYAKLINAQTNIAQRLLDIAQKRFDAGKAPGSEVLQAKLNLMQCETQINLACTRLIQDSAQLAYLLGETPNSEEIIGVEDIGLHRLLSGKNSLVPDPDRSLPSLDNLLPLAWQQRNDLKAAIQQAYANRKALTLAKSNRISNPFVGFSYLFSTYKPYQQQYFTPQPNSKTVPYQPGYLISVATETPIFYHYQGEINQAKATWIQQLKQNDQLRAQVASDIVTAYESLLVNKDNLCKCRQEILPAALTASRLSRRGYELGKTDLATVILAQQQYGQLAAAYFDSTIGYQNAWADLENAVGVPLNL